MNGTLQRALQLADLGYRVFPINADNKFPRISKANGGHGCKDATTDEDKLRTWWASYPDSRVGIATGAGLVVFDADSYKDGFDAKAWSELVKQLPNAPTQSTPSGGTHLFARIPEGVDCRCGTDVLGKHIDRRGHNGYVVDYNVNLGLPGDMAEAPTVPCKASQKKATNGETARALSRHDRVLADTAKAKTPSGFRRVLESEAAAGIIERSGSAGLLEIARMLPAGNSEPLTGDWSSSTTDKDFALPAICYRGPVKSYCESLTKTTEAAPAFHWLSYMTIVGQIVGRRAYLPGATWTYTNLFSVLVGDTGWSRKTSAMTRGRRLLREPVDYGINPIMMLSFEGLLERMAEDDEHAPEATGSRGLLMPGEFKSFAAKALQKSTSGLIPGITELYDCGPDYRHKLKGSEVVVERPFLSILTSSTDKWLKESISESQIEGGFLNRFVFVDAPTSSKDIPFEEQPDPALLKLATDAIDRLHSELPRDGLAMRWSAEAKDVYRPWYSTYKHEKRGDEMLQFLAPRGTNIAIKFAMLFSLLDGIEGVIEPDHIEAGVAFVGWHSKAQRRLFAGFTDDPKKRVEDRIVAAIGRFHADGAKPDKRAVQGRIGGKISSEDFNRGWRALGEAGAIDTDDDGVRLIR